jgi:transcriptional regulator with XRE-family HTH domain
LVVAINILMVQASCATLLPNMPHVLHIGTAVRLLRIAQNLTIPQLAEEAGVNPKTISKVERGEVNCTVSILGAIANALGCPDSAALEARLDEWCEQRIGPRRMKADWRAVIDLWDALSVAPEAQRAVLAFLRREVRLLPHRSAGSRDPVSSGDRHQRDDMQSRDAPHRGRERARHLGPEPASTASTTLPTTEVLTPTGTDKTGGRNEG